MVFPLLLISSIAQAATTEAAVNTDFKLDVNTALAGCAFLLLIVIVVLGFTLRSVVMFYHEKRKKEGAAQTGAKVLGLVFVAMLCASMPAMAQDVAKSGDIEASIIPESDVVRWMLYIVLTLELVVIFYFTKMIRFFTGIDVNHATAKRPSFFRIDLTKIWNKMNKFKSVEEEASIDTGHSYDGIRELNNVTPPWFIAGFVLSIIFGMIYMWRFHVVKSVPLQIEEYNISVAEAKIMQAAYLKTQANNVDENTVVVLGADGIAAGQALFAANCVACHGDKGQGASVGPNLTDNYWLHKGGIKDIFKTIKYGWQEKGMKSWKDDFSPNQIAQLASYVHSLKGSNPAGAKEAQGDLYTEDNPVAVAVDTTKAPVNDASQK